MKIYKAKDAAKSDPSVKPGDLFYIFRDMCDPRLITVGSKNGLGISLKIVKDLDTFFELCGNKPVNELPYLSYIISELENEKKEIEEKIKSYRNE